MKHRYSRRYQTDYDCRPKQTPGWFQEFTWVPALMLPQGWCHSQYGMLCMAANLAVFAGACSLERQTYGSIGVERGLASERWK
jgi:hypothetical protein